MKAVFLKDDKLYVTEHKFSQEKRKTDSKFSMPGFIQHVFTVTFWEQPQYPDILMNSSVITRWRSQSTVLPAIQVLYSEKNYHSRLAAFLSLEENKFPRNKTVSLHLTETMSNLLKKDWFRIKSRSRCLSVSEIYKQNTEQISGLFSNCRWSELKYLLPQSTPINVLNLKISAVWLGYADTDSIRSVSKDDL